MVPEFNVSQNTAMSFSFCTLKILLINVVSIWHIEIYLSCIYVDIVNFKFFVHVALDNNKYKTQSVKVQGEWAG
jgi:hypothetical protein